MALATDPNIITHGIQLALALLCFLAETFIATRLLDFPLLRR